MCDNLLRSNRKLIQNAIYLYNTWVLSTQGTRYYIKHLWRVNSWNSFFHDTALLNNEKSMVFIVPIYEEHPVYPLKVRWWKTTLKKFLCIAACKCSRSISSLLALHVSTGIHGLWSLVGTQHFLTSKMVKQVRVSNYMLLTSSLHSPPDLKCAINILSLLGMKAILVLSDSSLYHLCCAVLYWHQQLHSEWQFGGMPTGFYMLTMPMST